MILLWLGLISNECARDLSEIVEFPQELEEVTQDRPLFTLEQYLEAMADERVKDLKWLNLEIKVLTAFREKALREAKLERLIEQAKTRRRFNGSQQSEKEIK